MKGFDRTFRDEAENLRVQPPSSAWKRVESRLETQRIRRSARTARIMGYAAGVLLLIGLSIASLYVLSQPEVVVRDAYSASITELEVLGSSESIYNVEKARALSALVVIDN